MIHVVLVRWREPLDEATESELRERADATAAIPGVLAVAHGASVSPEGLEHGYEWGLVIDFASDAVRDDYLPHPLHRPLAELLQRLADDLVVFDLSR